MANKEQEKHLDTSRANRPASKRRARALDAAAQATLAVPRVEIEAPPGVTDVLLERGFAQLLIDCANLQSTSLNRADVYETLASEGVSVTFPQVHDDQISVVVRHEEAERAKDTIELHMNLGCTVKDDLALVTARAVDMRSLTGVMSRARAALLGAGVDPVQVGDSHASLFVLVPESLAEAAVKAWRKEFQLERGG